MKDFDREKYSLRILLEGRVDLGNFTFSIDPNSAVAKAIRAEMGKDFKAAKATDYFDADGRVLPEKRNELGNILMLDIIRAGSAERLGYYGKEKARDVSVATGALAEELVTAAFPNATNINQLAFSSNEPFADVQKKLGDGTEYISVKFTRDAPGAGTVGAEQMKNLVKSLKNKGHNFNKQTDRLSIIEIYYDRAQDFTITKIGPERFRNMIKDMPKSKSEVGAISRRSQIQNVASVKIEMPSAEFFEKLKTVGRGFLSGEDLARAVATGETDFPEAMATSSGAYGHVGDKLADKIAAFVTKAGADGRDAIQVANKIQDLLVQATESIEASGKTVDQNKLETLKKNLVAAVELVDKADGKEDKKLDLSEKPPQRQDEALTRKLFEWAVK